MLHCLVAHNLKGNTPEHQIMAVSDLASLEFKSDDTTATYMARLRGIQFILTKVTIDQLLTLFKLSKMDTALYPGIISLFNQGDNVLLSESLPQLETRMEREDRLWTLMDETPDSSRRSRPPPKPNVQQDQDHTAPSYPPQAQIKFWLVLPVEKLVLTVVKVKASAMLLYPLAFSLNMLPTRLKTSVMKSATYTRILVVVHNLVIQKS